MELSNFGAQLYKEFHVLLSVGNIYPYVHTKRWCVVTVVNYIVAYSLTISVMVNLAYTSYLTMDKLSYFSQAFHILIVGAVSMTASISITLIRKKADGLGELFCVPESFAPFAKSEYFQNLRKAGLKTKNRLIIFWVLMYGSCGVLGLLQSTIDSYAGTTPDVQKVNGVWINLPIVMWFPYDLENDIKAWLLAYAYEIVFLVYTAIQVIAAICVCFRVSNNILDQVKLSVWSVENLDLRAKTMFSQRYPLGKIRHMQKEYDECFYDCVKENVKHHLKIKETFERFVDISSIAIAVPFYGGAILLGMALITVTSDDDIRIGPKLMALMMGVSEAINMYNLCKAGQEFQDLSYQIFDKLFYTKWYNRSAKCKKALIILRYGTSRPLKLVAGRLLTLNMGFYADLVNSAYSIFNLKAASKE